MAVLVGFEARLMQSLLVHHLSPFIDFVSFCFLSEVQFWLAGACTVKPVATVVFLCGHVSCMVAKLLPLNRLSTLWIRARTLNCHQLTNLVKLGRYHTSPFLPQEIRGDRRRSDGEDLGEGPAGSVLCSEGFESTKLRGGI